MIGKFRKSYGLVALALVLTAVPAVTGCANVGSPSGGPKDETPPKLVGSTPAQNAIRFDVRYRKQVIKLTFDENINVKDASNLVVVSPPQKNVPEVSGVLKDVVVKLVDTIKPATTYTIDFLDGAIVDLNEGNAYGPLAFAFSTDSLSIDTLCVSGYVLDAQTLLPVSGVLVGAHSDLGDSTFIREPLLRITKTDDQGWFCLKNLKDSVPYNVFALNDLNRDYRFDQRGEQLAFSDSAVTLWAERCLYPDTLWIDSLTVDTVLMKEKTCFYPDHLMLKYYKEDYGRQYLAKSERADRGRLTFYLGFKSDTLPSLRLINLPDTLAVDTLDWNVLETVPTLDTLTYWLKDSALIKLDTLFVEINYLRTDSNDCLSPRIDTVRLLAPKEKVEQGKRGGKKAAAANSKRGSKKSGKGGDAPDKKAAFQEQIRLLTDSIAARTYDTDSLRLADSLRLERLVFVADSTLTSDSVRARRADSIRVADSIRAAIPKMKITAKFADQLDVNAVPTFEFEYPTVGMDTSVWHFFYKQDTLWKETRSFELEQDEFAVRKYYFYANWNYGGEYRITIDSASVNSIYGILIEKYDQSVKVKEEKEYARLTVTIEGLYGREAFLEVLDKSEKVIRQEYVVDGVADCLDMPPGDCYLRLVLDANDNGRWDPGCYTEKRQPETVIYCDRKITLKANWEDNETWNITLLPEEKQRPADLKAAEGKKKKR